MAKVRSTLRITLLVFSALIILSFMALMFWWTRPTKPQVVMGTATMGEIEATVATAGIVVPEEEFVARAAFPGEVKKLYVQLGQHVRAGQLLVSMKDVFAGARISTAEANLKSTEVARDNIKGNGSQEEHINFASDLRHAQDEESAALGSLDTLQKLQLTGDSSPVEIIVAQNRLHTATETLQTVRERTTNRFSPQDLASWNAHVDQAKVNLDAEKTNLSNINMSSSIAGVVYLIPVEENAFVPSGLDLVRVANPDKMKVTANFDEPEIGELRIGQTAEITWDGNPGHIWHGHLQHIPLAVVMQGQRHIGEASIVLEDTRQDLPAHTSVNVRVLLRRHPRVLVVPREALNQDHLGFFVYRIHGGELIRATVHVGIVTIDKVEITSGLAEGEEIALHRIDEEPMSNHLAIQIAR